MSYFVFIVLCLGAGFLGSFFTRMSVKTWYKTIRKPSWNPPDWIFPPVWTTLYVMMAVAAAMIWERRSLEGASIALVLFFIQFVLNVIWSPLFFSLRNPRLALVDIILLWIFIVATTVSFFKIYFAAGILLVPYLLWVSFACFLNFTIVRLNR